MLALAAVISTMQLTGAVPVEGGDYLLVTFQVPVGTVEMTVSHDDGSDSQILDWGVWSPDGFRGWGGGLTDPAIIGVAESSRGYVNGPITPGEWTLVIGKAKLGGQPGQYTVDLEFRDAATIPVGPRAPYAAVTLSTERRWYAGDFHVHSNESGDAPATLDQVVEYARGRGLDFIVLTEHNTTSHVPRIAARQTTLTDLLLVPGAEVTTYGGHATAVGVTSYIDHRVGLGGRTGRAIVDEVHARAGAFSINHPALDLGDLCIGCAWSHADTQWDQVDGIEIQTGNADLTAALFTPRTIALWDMHEDAGHHIAAIGGSDDHRAGTETGSLPARIGSPTTMVLADALSEQAIREAVLEGRTVVRFHGPEDPMVALVAKDTQSSRQAELGATLVDVGEVALEATIEGGDGAVVELWKDGVQVETRPISGAVTRFVRPVSGDPERYRVEVTRDGNRLTVTSHVYVDGDPSLAPGGCCDGGGGNGGAASLAMSGIVAAWLARRRRAPR